VTTSQLMHLNLGSHIIENCLWNMLIITLQSSHITLLTNLLLWLTGKGRNSNMEDKEGRERLRRHHRGLLPRPTQAPSMGSMAKSNGKSVQPLCEKIVLFEGRRKYVCAAVVEQSYHSPLLWSSSYSELGLLRAGRRQGVSSALANLLQAFSKGRNNVNQQDQSGVANAGILVVGGLLTVIKFAVLLLSRSLCSGAWPYLQVLSICTLPIGPLKHLVII